MLGVGVEAADLGRVDVREIVGLRAAAPVDACARAELHDVAEHRRRRCATSNALASAPAATRAAVSRALARSSTSRASVNPYFCMPARSACPGRGCVSGFAVAPGADDISSAHLPGRPLAVADEDRDRRAERAAVADAAEELDLVLLEAHARAAPVPEAPARQLGRDVVDAGSGARRAALRR